MRSAPRGGTEAILEIFAHEVAHHLAQPPITSWSQQSRLKSTWTASPFPQGMVKPPPVHPCAQAPELANLPSDAASETTRNAVTPRHQTDAGEPPSRFRYWRR